eukprot:scaffold21411_cov35-Prasinocladus_malaysianus.AAC.1
MQYGVTALNGRRHCSREIELRAIPTPDSGHHVTKANQSPLAGMHATLGWVPAGWAQLNQKALPDLRNIKAILRHQDVHLCTIYRPATANELKCVIDLLSQVFARPAASTHRPLLYSTYVAFSLLV